MTRNNKILIYSFLLGTIFSIVIIKDINVGCFFKTYFHIPCPGCGLTRAFIALFNFDFLRAIYYNYLVYPIVIIWFYCLFLIYKDILCKQNNLLSFYNKFFAKKYKLIIFLLVVAEFINIYHKI